MRRAREEFGEDGVCATYGLQLELFCWFDGSCL